MPDSFLDTNVLVYLASADIGKAERAEKLIAAGGVISVQVLNELTNVGRRKMRLSWAEMHDFLALVRTFLSVEPITVETHETGLALAERYGLSVYDAMIVAFGGPVRLHDALVGGHAARRGDRWRPDHEPVQSGLRRQPGQAGLAPVTRDNAPSGV